MEDVLVSELDRLALYSVGMCFGKIRRTGVWIMTHVDIDPFLLDQGFVFVHEDAFGHGEQCRVVEWSGSV